MQNLHDDSIDILAIETAASTKGDRAVIEKKIELIKQIRKRERFNKIELYDPYPFQVKFHGTGIDCNQRLLMAGNRTGKTQSGACETAIHALGGDHYPSWWSGRRFDKPTVCFVGGHSTESVRDISQEALLGTPGDPDAAGTGMIPRDRIIKTERKPGVPNAVSVAMVRHASGGTSYIYFKPYLGASSLPEAWMGRSIDFAWLDEEPPREVYSQAVTRTLDRKGMVFVTFTPENGMTETVASFINDLKPRQSLTTASWDDASENVKTLIHKTPGHLSEMMMDQVLASYPPHERNMRRDGQPSIGSGLVFPVPEEKIMCEPFVIPEDWPRIAGMDFGWTHNTSVIWAAMNPETYGTDAEEVVLYDCYSASKTPPHIHAAAIKTRGGVPIAWPHDGNRSDSMGNPGLAEQYRNLGLNLLPMHFSNPPALGEKKGSNCSPSALVGPKGLIV